MDMSTTDPFEQANEADVAEQAQDLDGSGAGNTAPEYSRTEAAEADILEQDAEFSDTEGEEAYPHAAEEDDSAGEA